MGAEHEGEDSEAEEEGSTGVGMDTSDDIQERKKAAIEKAKTVAAALTADGEGDEDDEFRKKFNLDNYDDEEEGVQLHGL